MASRLDRQLAAFLRKQQGDSSYAEFAKRLGISPGMLHRLRHEEQSATLRALNQILDRLKCKPSDVFVEKP